MSKYVQFFVHQYKPTNLQFQKMLTNKRHKNLLTNLIIKNKIFFELILINISAEQICFLNINCRQSNTMNIACFTNIVILY